MMTASSSVPDAAVPAHPSSSLLLTREGAGSEILVATLNRASTLNAIDWDVLAELDRALASVAADSAIRCLLIEAAGERAFSAGADLRVAAELTPEQAAEWIRAGHGVFNRLVRCRVPVVAALQGYVLGGGLELALACDLRIAADTAQFGLPEVTRGWMPGWGGARRLAALIGPSRARSLLFLGDRLTAEQALAAGLVCRVVSSQTLSTATRELAAKLATLAPSAVREAKAHLTPVGLLIHDDEVEQDAQFFAQVVTQPAFSAEIQSFLNRRKG